MIDNPEPEHAFGTNYEIPRSPSTIVYPAGEDNNKQHPFSYLPITLIIFISQLLESFLPAFSVVHFDIKPLIVYKQTIRQ